MTAHTGLKPRPGIVLGTGDAAQHRFAPTFRRLRSAGLIGRIAFLDLPAECLLERLPDEGYFRIHDNQIPFDRLGEAGLLDDEPLFVVATSSAVHGHYAVQIAHQGFEVAIEKPTVLSTHEAIELLLAEGRFHCIEHFLHKEPVWMFLMKIKGGFTADVVTQATGVRVKILEAKPADPRRRIDPMIWDIGWHALALIQQSFRLAGFEARFVFQRVETARHEATNDSTRPLIETLARLRGLVRFGANSMPFDIQVGKAVRDDKAMTWTQSHGDDVSIRLDESGHLAHLRQMRDIIRDEPPMLPLPDAVRLVQLCEQASRISEPQDDYLIGTTPAMLDEMQEAAS